MAALAVLLTSESDLFDFLTELNNVPDEFFETAANYRGLTFTVIGSGRNTSRWINIDDVDGMLAYEDDLRCRLQATRDLTLLADFTDERARKAQ